MKFQALATGYRLPMKPRKQVTDESKLAGSGTTESNAGRRSMMTFDSTMTRADLQILPKTVQQQTVERLRTAILEGVFKPGERLVEAEVAPLLGISRPSLREALRSLEGERLVTIIPNRGPHVSVVTWEEAEQIYQVRMLLEGEAAALSATRAKPEHFSRMRKALDDFCIASLASDRRGLVTATTTFYGILLESCGNQILEELQKGLLARINFLRNQSMSRPSRSAESLREMTAIHDAITQHDAGAARQAAIRHVECASIAAKAAYEGDATTSE